MKKTVWCLALCMLLVLLPVAQLHAQDTWVQVWSTNGSSGPTTIEYRDSAGNVLAAYTMTINWPRQAGGRLVSSDRDNVILFDPFIGAVNYYPASGLPNETDQYYEFLNSVILAPNGQTYAYGVVRYYYDGTTPSNSRIFVSPPGTGNERLVLDETLESSFLSLQPMGWTQDSRLLIEEMPMGIGGYILYWQHQNVRLLDLNTGAISMLGNLDGYSADGRLTATVEWEDDGVTGLLITDTTSGQTAHYPLPALGEGPMVGGDATFSPAGTRVAYQVARNNPEQEMFWTIVVDLQTGISSVVLQDEAINYESNYGSISGWMNDTTLVVGDGWSTQSAVIDATTNALLREERGAFLGYAQGLTDTAGFVPSGAIAAQCPGAPPSRLQLQQRGRITFTDGTLTNVRQAPNSQGEKVDAMPEGATFTVFDGPICADGFAWWYVEFDTGLSGYVAEGTASGYFLEPWQ